MKTLPAKSFFTKKNIDFVLKNFKKILQGKSFLSQYKFAEEFEKKFSNYVKSNYAISCNSGTSALELIFRVIGVNKKEVIIPSNTFLATALGIINAGGIIKFADCDNEMCVSLDSIINNITTKTKAIVVVHIGGIITKDIFEIQKLCKKKNIYLIEDAAQAHGSKINGQFAGSIGDFSTFSFYSTKIITTGEGGMITFKNKKYLKRFKSLREFGKIKKGFYINYHKYIGYNWRFQEINALMGIAQLHNIEKFIAKRKKIANVYINNFQNLNQVFIINPYRETKIRQNYYKFIIVLKKFNRIILHKKLKNLSFSLSGYVYEFPLHKQPVFKNYNKIKLKNTERLCSTHICLPIYYEMTEEIAQDLCNSIKKIIL